MRLVDDVGLTIAVDQVSRRSRSQAPCARSCAHPRSLARECLAFLATQACNRLALIVALACNCPALIVPRIVAHAIKQRAFIHAQAGAFNRCSSLLIVARERLAFIAAHACNSLALSSTLKLENVLRSSSLVLALALRSPIVCLSILNIHPHVRDMPCVHHHRTCLQEPNTHRSSSLLTLAIILRSSTLKLRTILRSTTLIASLSQSTYPHIYACSSGRRKRPHRCAFALCSV